VGNERFIARLDILGFEVAAIGDDVDFSTPRT